MGILEAALRLRCGAALLNARDDHATQYLSDGIAEQVVDDLSQLSSLRVMAWATVSRYRQPQVDARAVGRDLGVKAVLVGRLIRKGDRIVLQTELVDVGGGSRLWGQRYERNMSEIAQLQQQLSHDIASNLRVRLAGGEENKMLHRYSASPTAYELYLKGRFFWAKRTSKVSSKALITFSKRLVWIPTTLLRTPGWRLFNLVDDWGETPPRESFPKARAAADKAIALDPSLAEAHVSWPWCAEVMIGTGLAPSKNSSTQ